MDNSYLMAALGRGALALMRGARELVKLIFFVSLLVIPMYAVVFPYCSYMVDITMPANTPERLWGAMAGIVGGVVLMAGIPALAFWFYGRRLAAKMWPEEKS